MCVSQSSFYFFHLDIPAALSIRYLDTGNPMECAISCILSRTCSRLYGNKAEAWLSYQGYDKQSTSVFECQAHEF